MVFIVGLFLLAYVLDAAVDPLDFLLATPYQYISPKIFSQYPFTIASIFIKALALFLTPLWLLSFMEKQYSAKGVILLVLAGLTQLYGLQELATGARLLPIEWTVSLAVAGATMLVPAVLFLTRGTLSSVHEGLAGPSTEENPFEEEEEE